MSMFSQWLSGEKKTETTSQNQYTPYAQGQIGSALQQGQQVAQTPFQTPQQPVAGFSPDQLAAFQSVRNAQGYANPYIQQGANYFTPEGTQQFMNPYASAVGANLQDIFGAQMRDVTGNLTQAAGGVGADRIALGQSNLAKQQGLAAGQIFSDLYARSADQAQRAGYGTAQLGLAGQGAQFQGAQALLGAGGLQQQLAQMFMNSPYQQQLQQIAWPYQNAAFNAQITGALAPQMGGTATSSGTTVQTDPGGAFGKLVGLGTTAMGMMGGMPGMGMGGGMGGNMGQYATYDPAGTQIYGPGFAGGGGVDRGDRYLAEARAHLDESFARLRGGRVHSASPDARSRAFAYASGGAVPNPMLATDWANVPAPVGDNPHLRAYVDPAMAQGQSQFPQAGPSNWAPLWQSMFGMMRQNQNRAPFMQQLRDMGRQRLMAQQQGNANPSGGPPNLHQQLGMPMMGGMPGGSGGYTMASQPPSPYARGGRTDDDRPSKPRPHAPHRAEGGEVVPFDEHSASSDARERAGASFDERFAALPPEESPSAYQSAVDMLMRGRDAIDPLPPSTGHLGRDMLNAVPTAINMMRPRGPMGPGTQALAGTGLAAQFAAPSEARAAGLDTAPSPEEAAEIGRLRPLIEAQKKKVQNALRAGNEKSANAARFGLDALQRELDRIEGPESLLGQRRAAALRLQTAGAERSQRAGEPFAQKFPDYAENLQKWGLPVHGATGVLAALASRGKSLWKPAAFATGVGGLEGAAGAAWPTIQDAMYASEGSPAKEGALNRIWSGDPKFWKTVGTGVLEGAIPAGIGSVLTTKLKALAPGSKTAAPPAVPAPPPPPPRPVGKPYMDAGGRWRDERGWLPREHWPKNGNWRGGRIPYATGGMVDFEDMWEPTADALRSGIFDPAGENNSAYYFGEPPPLPRPRPASADEPLQGEVLPPTASPAMSPPAPAMASSPYAGMPPAPQRERGFIDSPWAALTAAGLGMMSKGDIGAGGLQGLGLLERQRDRQISVDERALQLDRQVQQMRELERHHRATEDVARANLARENVTYLGATADGTGSIFLDRRSGKTRVEPIQVAGKAKPIPTGLQKDLGEKAGLFHELVGLENSFKPGYGGSTFGKVGDLQNYIARQTGVGNVDAADWWQRYQNQNIEVRHGKFGAALTVNETREWEKAAINPGMTDDMIKRNVRRQREIVEGAIKRRGESLAKQGYNKEAIEAEIGRGLEELGTGPAPAAAAPAGPPPKVGEVRTNKHGVKGRWNGQGWEVMQ